MSFIPEVNVLEKEDFMPATIVLKGIFTSKIDINILSKFLFIDHKFNKKNERIKLISGSRKNIEYFGPEGSIVSIGYKNNRRGMRTGAMNNMVSIDMQLGGKNIHIKFSSTSITNVGTRTVEAGKKVIKKILEHATSLQQYLDYSNSLTKEEKEENIQWLTNELENFEEGTRKKDLINELRVPKGMNERYINFLINYFDDFDEKKDFKNHCQLTKEILILCEEKVSCKKYAIYNSVFHMRPISNPNFKMPLHKLAPFLALKGVYVSWHNALSEGLNICFDVEEEKVGINHEDKFYKHRFTIYITSKIKQTSPTLKDEAYKYYAGLMNLIKMFFKEKDIDFKKYITNNIPVNDNIKILLQSKDKEIIKKN